MSNLHTIFGWISLNGKGEDSITDCDDARNPRRFFFEKSYLLTDRWFNLDVLFIYSKENCIIWHLLASTSALLEFVSSSVPAVLEYRLFQTSICTDLSIIGLEFIVFITLKWSNFAGSSSPGDSDIFIHT